MRVSEREERGERMGGVGRTETARARARARAKASEDHPALGAVVRVRACGWGA